MAIKNSNATDPSLKLGGDIQTEFGGNNPVSISEYYSGAGLVALGTVGEFGAIPASGAISFSDFYGSISDALPQGTPGIVLSGTTDIVSNVALGDALRVKVDNITDDNTIVANSWEVRWYLDGQLDTPYYGPYSVLQDGTLPFEYGVSSNLQFEKNIYAEVRFSDQNNNVYVLQSNTVFVGSNAQPGEYGVTVSGGTTNGSTLTASAVFSDVFGNPAASTSYTWLRSSNNTLDLVNDTIVKLASEPNPTQYEITPNDIGSYLFCFVVFTDGVGDIFTASDSVQAINDPASGTVTLATQPAGSAAVPEVTLRATANISDDDGIASYEFNFRRESAPLVNIQQTTVTPPSNTADYTTTQADDGERIFVVMDVTDNAIVPNTRRATSDSILISQGTSYSVSSGANSITEGDSVTFTVTVSNAQAETLNWSVTGTAVDSNRVTLAGEGFPAVTSGTITVAAAPSVQTFDITINTASANFYQGPQAFRLGVTGASAPDANSGNVTLNDAAFTASVTTPTAVDEGTAISVSATATNLPDTNWDVRIKTVTGGSFATQGTVYNLIFAWDQLQDQYVASASIPTTADATEFDGGSIVLEIRNTNDVLFTERTVTINNTTVQTNSDPLGSPAIVDANGDALVSGTFPGSFDAYIDVSAITDADGIVPNSWKVTWTGWQYSVDNGREQYSNVYTGQSADTNGLLTGAPFSVGLFTWLNDLTAVVEYTDAANTPVTHVFDPIVFIGTTQTNPLFDLANYTVFNQTNLTITDSVASRILFNSNGTISGNVFDTETGISTFETIGRWVPSGQLPNGEYKFTATTITRQYSGGTFQTTENILGENASLPAQQTSTTVEFIGNSSSVGILFVLTGVPGDIPINGATSTLSLDLTIEALASGATDTAFMATTGKIIN